VTEPRWLPLGVVLAIQADQISKHGGATGLRDRGLLESALERPRNRFYYDLEGDLADLAASYGFGIARNHPFVDGNKRIAFQAMYVFLGLNGLKIESSEEEVVALVLSLARGEVDEPQLASWLREHTVPR
jgi:death on curing protein